MNVLTESSTGICGWSFLAGWIVISVGQAVANAPPEVSNVDASQRAQSGIVDIYYDLVDAEDDASIISIQVSDTDGQTWVVPVSTASGDIGPGVTPGNRKHIEWNLGEELPCRVGSLLVRVKAHDPNAAPSGMVLIPAGRFEMGDGLNDNVSADELPAHRVYVDDFYLARYEVTNQQYVEALNRAVDQGRVEYSGGIVYKAGSAQHPYCSTTADPTYPTGEPAAAGTLGDYSRIARQSDDTYVVTEKLQHPVCVVSWYGAAAYANWRSAMDGRSPCYNLSSWECDFTADGYRLPTEAEWERAARGGAEGFRFPWPDSYNIDHSRANYFSDPDSATRETYDTSSTHGYHPVFGIIAPPYTNPVGYFAPNPYGLYDMAGNAREWCNDWYSSTGYETPQDPDVNPRGPDGGAGRTSRGGMWGNRAQGVRCANRYHHPPEGRYWGNGFRLVARTPAASSAQSPPFPAVAGPRIVRQPAMQDPCPDYMAVFRVSADGEVPVFYRWQKNRVDLTDGGHVSGADSPTLIIQPIDEHDAGLYRCRVSCAGGEVFSDEAPLNPKGPATITEEPTSTSTKLGGTAAFGVKATGSILSYEWRKDGVSLQDGPRISGANGPTLTITGVVRDDEGPYQCRIIGDCGSVYSEEVQLDVVPILYVAKTGSDANDGLSWETAKLTVQAALDASVAGDQVWVAAGTYVQCIALKNGVGLYGGFAGNEQGLSGRNWATNVTILDGDAEGSVVYLAYGATETTRLDGFTIRNGSGISSGQYSGLSGGGIYCRYSSPVLVNNTIAGNSVSGFGGGILCEHSSPRIQNNVIARNSAAEGGGIWCDYDSQPTIVNTRILGNTANGSWSRGGGVVSSGGMIENCTISGNVAGVGGGLALGGAGTIKSSFITGNAASHDGGGITCGEKWTVENCTVVGNSDGEYGGGISCAGSSPRIVNTIVAFNTSGVYWHESQDPPRFEHNCIFGNQKYDYYGFADPPATDIRRDPLLVDVGYGNVHIKLDSPCIDAGQDAVVQPGDRDIDGQPRIQGSHVDIGADESDGSEGTPGPQAIVRVSLTGDDANDGLSWATAKRTVQAGIDAAAVLAGEVWVAGGTYAERISLRPYVHVFGGFHGQETVRTDRDWSANVTALDGQQQGSVVTARLIGPLTATIDGFTIRNGSGTDRGGGYRCGGGVYCEAASPTIANCIITRNNIDASYAYGGGIYCNGSPIITRCAILENSLKGYGQQGSLSAAGGGMYWASGSLPVMTHCTVAKNVVKGGGLHGVASGGGLHGEDSATAEYAATIEENTIKQNSVSDATFCYGGGILCGRATRIARNTIAENYSEWSGGGVYCASYSGSIVNNNTIVGNRAGNAGGGIGCSEDFPSAVAYVTIANNTIMGNQARHGGGIWSQSKERIENNVIVGNTAAGQYDANGGGIACSGSPEIVNCTIAGNSAVGEGGGIHCSDSPTITNLIVAFNSSGLHRTNWGTLTLVDNCVFGNSLYDYSGIADPTGTNGNIKQDPLFVDAAYANVHIKPNSPCRDAGDDTVVQPGDTDIDGQPRIQGAHVDIGADESDGSAGTTGPHVIVRVSPSGDDNNDGQTWSAAKRTVQAGIDAVSARAGDVWVAQGTYPERITLRPYAHLFGGFAGSETAREQRNWLTSQTTLDGQQGGSVVTASGLARLTATIDGFTIRNGIGTDTSGYGHRSGGGIYCLSASPTIANCAFRDNSVTEYGGGIYSNAILSISNCTLTANSAGMGAGGAYCAGPIATVVNCVIAGNTINAAGWSGGIYCSGSLSLTGSTIRDNTGDGIWCAASSSVANCRILDNTGAGLSCHLSEIRNCTVAGNRGGGIVCSSSTIADCTISDNRNTGSGGGIICHGSTITGNTVSRNSALTGGGILCSGSPTINSNVITGNSSTSVGGGIFCMGGSSPSIENNTIARNGASSGGGVWCDSSAARIVNSVIVGNTAAGQYDANGGGIACSGSPEIVNCTIAGNSAVGEGGGIHCSGAATIANSIMAFNSSGLYRASWGTLTLVDNCVFGNALYDYSGITDPTGTDGNLKQDPLFVDAAYGNVHIKPNSPCRDAGDDTVVQQGDVDIDGQPRIQGTHVDIGADESDGSAGTPGPQVIVRVSPTGDNSNDGQSWNTAKRTVQAGIDAVGSRAGEVWVAAGTYPERITLRPYAHLFGGFAGRETAREQRDWATSQTTLDGQQGGSVVTVQLVAVGTTTIDGFIIRNGTGTDHETWSTYRYGGGIYCDRASPAIANCTIRDNTVQGESFYYFYGGGIACRSGSPAITNCTITGNSAVDCGGIYCGGGSPTITNCRIAENTGIGVMGDYSHVTLADSTITDNGGRGIACSDSSRIVNCTVAGNTGGGISCSNASLVVNCTIAGNSNSDRWAVGGGVYCSSSNTTSDSPTIVNCIIMGNRVNGSDGAYGGGIYCANRSPTIANCTIAGNSVSGGWTTGGGIAFGPNTYSYAMLVNSIVAFNSSGIARDNGDVPTLRYNCVFGNAASDYYAIPDPTGSDGNISSDPRFVRNPGPGPDGEWGTGDDDSGDLRLRVGSGCIDAASNVDVPTDAADLDGDSDTTEALPIDLAGCPRFFNDPVAPDSGAGDPPIVDMGAYEHPLPSAADFDRDGDVDEVDLEVFQGCATGPAVLYDPLTLPGSAPGCTLTPDSTGHIAADFDSDGDVDMDDFGAFQLSFRGPGIPVVSGCQE